MNILLPPFIDEQYQANQTNGEFEAYTLFIDLSGFTPLTEELMQEGSAGAARLSLLLNDIYEPLVQLVYARGGFIPYFAGDAFTAIFPSDTVGIGARELIETALMARQLFTRRDSRFDKYTIGIKTGLAFGIVEWGIVGKNRKAFYFRGQPIDQCAYCQTMAGDQEIVVDHMLRLQLAGKHIHLEEVALNAYKVVGTLPVPFLPLGEIQPIEIARKSLLAFYPPEVIDYKQDGEFRTVVSVFLAFDGLDKHHQLDLFADVVLEQVHDFGGYFKEIDFGDKGGVMLCFFGAPVSFENNLSRASEFILSVREIVSTLQMPHIFHFRAGLTIGTAYTGNIGGRERCQYACVGNRVNLAARLMTYADWGEILVDAEVSKNKSFRFLHKGDIKYKGIKGNIPTFKLLGRDYGGKQYYEGRLIEREEELGQLLRFLKPLQQGATCGVAYVYGEAGVGKSHLTFELRRRLEAKDDISWYLGQSDQILRKPFNPFTYFLRNYFSQSPERGNKSNLGNFERRYQNLYQAISRFDTPAAIQIRRELERTKEVLGILVGLHFKNSLWDELDAKGRYRNTISAIINLLMAESLIKPVIFELEDGHWMDESSKELLSELLPIMRNRPIVLLVTARYQDDGGKAYIIPPAKLKEEGLPCLEIDLNTLPASAVRAFAEDDLKGPISEEFFELLLRTTNSNPFYLEQVLEYFVESDLLTNEDGTWTIKDKNVKLSNSINAILTARIDRLSAMVRETVKAAAVIGREFEIPVLQEVMRGQETGNVEGDYLKDRIRLAEEGQIWTAVNELRYIFRHSLLREAVYGMQLGTRLQQLHNLIAVAIEKLYVDNLEERYVDLAFHYDRAGIFDKTCYYLRKAADFARANYQNQLALEFYEKLLLKLGKQADDVDQIKTHLKRGKVLELIGNWEEANAAYERAIKLAKKSRDVLLLGETNDALGHLLTLQGKYNDAMHHLQAAAGLFDSVEDEIGIAKAFGHIGNLHLRHGEYDQALNCFEKALSTGYADMASAGSAQVVANLGMTHMNLGRFDAGIDAIKSQLEATRLNGDKQGLATLYTHLGIVYFEKGAYNLALEAYQEGLALAEELGNIQLISIAAGCMGSVYERQGDYDTAMSLFERDLELCERIGDKQGIAIALGLIGELMSIRGQFHKAIEYLQKNLMLCEELGYQKGIAKAVNTLGDVFYFTGQYDRSLNFYDRAIERARKIENKMVLGSSLVEKGSVLIATNRESELRQVVSEALQTAEELANPDLLFDAKILQAKSFVLFEKPQEATAVLDLLEQDPAIDEEQKARLYFERFQLDKENLEARNKAVDIYQKLFENTPNFIYRDRLESLGALV